MMSFLFGALLLQALNAQVTDDPAATAVSITDDFPAATPAPLLIPGPNAPLEADLLSSISAAEVAAGVATAGLDALATTSDLGIATVPAIDSGIATTLAAEAFPDDFPVGTADVIIDTTTTDAFIGDASSTTIDVAPGGAQSTIPGLTFDGTQWVFPTSAVAAAVGLDTASASPTFSSVATDVVAAAPTTGSDVAGGNIIPIATDTDVGAGSGGLDTTTDVFGFFDLPTATTGLDTASASPALLGGTTSDVFALSDLPTTIPGLDIASDSPALLGTATPSSILGPFDFPTATNLRPTGTVRAGIGGLAVGTSAGDAAFPSGTAQATDLLGDGNGLAAFPPQPPSRTTTSFNATDVAPTAANGLGVLADPDATSITPIRPITHITPNTPGSKAGSSGVGAQAVGAQAVSGQAVGAQAVGGGIGVALYPGGDSTIYDGEDYGLDLDEPLVDPTYRYRPGECPWYCRPRRANEARSPLRRALRARQELGSGGFASFDWPDAIAGDGEDLPDWLADPQPSCPRTCRTYAPRPHKSSPRPLRPSPRPPRPSPYKEEPLSYKQDTPSYTQNPPSYTQNPPSYTQDPPSYTQDPPSYTQDPPSYTQVPPSYTQDPPSYTQKPSPRPFKPSPYSQDPWSYVQEPSPRPHKPSPKPTKTLTEERPYETTFITETTARGPGPSPYTVAGAGDHGWTGNTLSDICPKTCNPFNPSLNFCDITTSCNNIGGDKYYCACRGGYKAAGWNEKDFSKQFHVPGQPYVFVGPNVKCDQPCKDQLCTEVLERPRCL